MKPMTFVELDSVVDLANSYAGGIVEDIIFSKGLLYLGLQSKNIKPWLILDTQSVKPGFYCTLERPPQVKPEVKPLLLFLKARLKGAEFLGAERVKDYGRRVILKFDPPAYESTAKSPSKTGRENLGGDFEIEGHFFPQNKNLIVRHGKAQVHLAKPKELSTIEEKDFPAEVRSVAQLYREWLADFQDRKGGKSSPDGGLSKELEKKTKGLEKLKESLKEMKLSPWRAAGDWLSAHRDQELPEELKSFFDSKKSWQENIERCYLQAKQAKSKMAGAAERILKLETEIAQLERAGNGDSGGKNQKSGAIKKPTSLLENARGRTKVFSDEITAYIGRSAADNLKLLRNAKAWYIWVHAKDMPGSHGIIALPKNKSLPDPVLREVALWVLRESLTPKQWQEWQGMKLQIIYCECRFVSPIKGDKLGRVRHKNERVLTLIVQP